MSNPNFRITRGKGFRIQFPNGYSVSVQFCPYSYCDNQDRDISNSQAGENGCDNAEVAVIGPNGFYRLEGEQDIIGWVHPMRLLEILNHVAGLR